MGASTILRASETGANHRNSAFIVWRSVWSQFRDNGGSVQRGSHRTRDRDSGRHVRPPTKRPRSLHCPLPSATIWSIFLRLLVACLYFHGVVLVCRSQSVSQLISRSDFALDSNPNRTRCHYSFFPFAACHWTFSHRHSTGSGHSSQTHHFSSPVSDGLPRNLPDFRRHPLCRLSHDHHIPGKGTFACTLCHGIHECRCCDCRARHGTFCVADLRSPSFTDNWPSEGTVLWELLWAIQGRAT